EILKKACLDSPSKSPRLSDLVAVPERSKLPNWMHSSPPLVVVPTKTREATDRGGRYVPGIDWGPDNEQPSSGQPSSTLPPPSPSPVSFSSSQTSHNPQTGLFVLEEFIAPVLMGLGWFWMVMFGLLVFWGLLTLFAHRNYELHAV